MRRPPPRHRAEPAPRHTASLSAVTAVVLLLSAGTAWAHWTAGSVPGGSGAAKATSMQAGTAPTASASGSAVTLTWSASSLASGHAVDGYVVTRYDAATHSAQTTLTGCAGVVAATTCVESGVPDGYWTYTVTPAVGTYWRGTESAFSNVVRTPVPDTTGPSGGSVDASGLTGTGARYSTSTSLQIGFSPGTDPSGLAASGAQLLVASATLGSGDGSCGTFGSYGLVATDPASPRAVSVADQACYRYRYVVADSVGNTTTYTSGDVKVDTTAPSTPTLSFTSGTNTWWSGSGTSVYYRSGASSGSFTATASSSDSASGIAGYTFPALGANWTSTPGSTGVNTYSWSGAPAAPGATSVTSADNAGLVSAGRSFSMVADDTAPTAGTINYADGTTSSTSVSVSFTTGTDAGSGIASRLLQRASATLTNGTCGSYGAFATVSGGTNPSSPFGDTVTAGSCYRYQYVVTDNVGNATTASSASVVKASMTYSALVLATAGLHNYWRLEDTPTSSDTFTDFYATSLQSHTGEIGAGWVKHPVSSADAVIDAASQIHKAGTGTVGALYYTTTTPTSADYRVEADLDEFTTNADDMAGVVGRLDPTNANGTYYLARQEVSRAKWVLYKVVNGSWTWLGEADSPTVWWGSSNRVTLDMRGSSIKLLVNGTTYVSVTDGSITGAGRGGISLGFNGSTGTSIGDWDGYHVDNFKITYPVVDSAGSDHGELVNGPTTGVTGALSTPAGSAIRFDGVDDYVTVARQIADDFSIELWFKSTQGIGFGTDWWTGAGLVDADTWGPADDFGLSLNAAGRLLAGVGVWPETTVVSSVAGLNDGNWHHVVYTRTKSTGLITLYADGVVVGTATGATSSLTATPTMTIGRINSVGNNFAGTIDEVATYDVALSAATVAAHYAAR